MHRLRQFSLAMLISMFLPLASAYAGNVTTVLPIHVTVLPHCGVSTNGIEFGAWSQQTVVGKGTIGVACAKGIDYQVSLSAGASFDAANQTRQLSGPNPTRKLSYRLYQDSGLSIEWGDRGYANSYPLGSSVRGTGTNSAQPITVYGKIPSSSEHLPPGSYSDTVLVTVHF